MIRTVLFLLVINFYSTLVAQTDPTSIQKNIDQTLWAPFKKAYEGLDAQSLNALYADEVLRVTPNGIDTQNEFKSKNLERLQAFKTTKTNIKLDFWFDSRHTNQDTSYEVGFYRIKITTKGETEEVYGQFHIVLKKIKGVWKITQDWDTTTINSKTITAVDFNRKEPIKFQ